MRSSGKFCSFQTVSVLTNFLKNFPASFFQFGVIFPAVFAEKCMSFVFLNHTMSYNQVFFQVRGSEGLVQRILLEGAEGNQIKWRQQKWWFFHFPFFKDWQNTSMNLEFSLISSFLKFCHRCISSKHFQKMVNLEKNISLKSSFDKDSTLTQFQSRVFKF